MAEGQSLSPTCKNLADLMRYDLHFLRIVELRSLYINEQLESDRTTLFRPL
jgi:hypothetical protein